MMAAMAVASAFERSRPFVETLNSYRSGPELPPSEVVDQVCRTLWDRRGKRLRSHLVYWFGEMAGVSATPLRLYAWAAEAVHTATLLHDDVIDLAEVRRGGPSANALFGNTLPVLSGDYLLSDAVQRIAENGDPRLLAGLCAALKELVCGEAMQYEMAYTIPSAEHLYARVAGLKTTSLMRWAALVGPTLAASPWRSDLFRFMGSFGQLFQFSDDLLDVVGSEDKAAWVDLKEGKLNFVTWQLLQSEPRLKAPLQKAFERRSVDPALLRLFENSVSRAFLSGVHDRLQAIAAQATRHLEGLPDTPIRAAAEGLITLCLDRTR